MEFAVAVINNFGGFYSRELYFYELMKSGAHVHRPCVNNSHLYTSIRQSDAHVGFIHVKNLESSLVERLLAERERSGLFTSLVDFVERVRPEREQLDILTRTDALRFTGKTKKELLWEGDFLQSKTSSVGAAAPRLFGQTTVKLDLPVLPVYCLDDYYDDIELLGFPVGDPFLLADDDPAAYTPGADLHRYAGKPVTVLGYHITHKPVRTVKGQVMSFGTFIDSRKDWIDTVHFPPVHAATPPGAGFFRITGKVIEDFGMYSIEVTQVSKVGIRSRQALLPKAS
jgi:DNA polymerase-3 subunit alpha